MHLDTIKKLQSNPSSVTFSLHLASYLVLLAVWSWPWAGQAGVDLVLGLMRCSLKYQHTLGETSLSLRELLTLISLFCACAGLKILLGS